jgi:LmbE family N-acetylglucosaminyl deacetylase
LEECLSFFAFIYCHFFDNHTTLKPHKYLITFGVEGWTGHPDHHFVGNIVTEVFTSTKRAGNPKLYFPALVTLTIAVGHNT